MKIRFLIKTYTVSSVRCDGVGFKRLEGSTWCGYVHHGTVFKNSIRLTEAEVIKHFIIYNWDRFKDLRRRC